MLFKGIRLKLKKKKRCKKGFLLNSRAAKSNNLFIFIFPTIWQQKEHLSKRMSKTTKARDRFK